MCVACGIHVIKSCCTCVLQEYMMFYSSCSLLFSLSLSLSVRKGNLACTVGYCVYYYYLMKDTVHDEMELGWYEI